MDYVMGLAFTPDPLPYTRVLMIEKLKPAWQAGKLNGVGGKIDHYLEEGRGGTDYRRLETPLEAMVREFHEETGVLSDQRDWHLFCIMHDGYFSHQVYCYESREPRLYYDAQTMEAEKLHRIPVNGVCHPQSYPLVHNMPAKILLALDRESWLRPTFFVYGGGHFAGTDLKTAVAADPAIDPSYAAGKAIDEERRRLHPLPYVDGSNFGE
jgi:8-oxo-dGTP diphosphatase